jgi:hypothetical protein
MVLQKETDMGNVFGSSGENSAEKSLNDCGFILVVGSSGMVYLSRKVEDKHIGKADQLVPGQAENPMTTD